MLEIRNRQGFTLIELMIIVVIIGILTALAIPRFTIAFVNSETEQVLQSIIETEKNFGKANGYYAKDLTWLESHGYNPPENPYCEIILTAEGEELVTYKAEAIYNGSPIYQATPNGIKKIKPIKPKAP